ncbi:MAG: hypothetical protein ABIP45_02335 [Knoellia sp.]
MSEQFSAETEPESAQTPTEHDSQAPDHAESAEPELSTTVDDGAPETGDLVIDAALRDLADTPGDDLDGQIERGEQVQRTLQGRLSDLGG